MVILTGYYSVDKERSDELASCLNANVSLNFVESVVIFCEKGSLPAADSPKIKIVPVDSRQTYGDFIEYANNYLAGQIVIVSNTDILYNASLKLFLSLKEDSWKDTLYAITRTNEDGKLQNEGSQDTWVFKAPLKKFNWNITLGINGCDSYFSQKANAAGIRIVNPALSIRCVHVHKKGTRCNSFRDGTCYWNVKDYACFTTSYSKLNVT